MKKRRPLSGYQEADWELQGAILKVTLETRVLLSHLRELRQAVRRANRYGTLWNFERHLVDYLNKDMALNLQRITRQVNTARRSVLEFLKQNNAPFPLSGTEEP